MDEERFTIDRSYGSAASDMEVIRELQLAFGQVDRGEVSDLDMKSLLVEAHRRYAVRWSTANDERTRQRRFDN